MFFSEERKGTARRFEIRMMRERYGAVNNFLSKKMFAYEIKLLYLHKISER